MSANQFIIEELSPFNVPETVARLIEEAGLKGWQNPATHNLQQSLAKAGKEVRPVQVVEICKPEYSGKMLEMNDERIVSVLMPCRISVYEKENGKTYVSLLDMKALVSGLPVATAEGIRHASDETLGIVHAVTGV